MSFIPKTFPRTLHSAGIILTWGSLSLASLPIAAQSLLANPEFDADVSGWILSVPPPVWDGFDIDDSTSSGSALLTNSLPAAGAEVVALAQCFNLPLPNQLEFGIGGYIPGGQSTGGSVVVRVDQYRDPDCTGGLGGTTGYFVVRSNTPDSWVDLLRSRSLLTAVESIRFEVGIRKDAAGDTFMAFVDAGVLQVEQLIFAEGFE